MSNVKVIEGRNVNEVFQLGVMYFKELFDKQEIIDSRYGACIRHHGPFITQYNNPRERVLFNPLRDANPFFHLMESLWMLAGRQDAAFLEKFNKKMLSFSDDGKNYHGAYGFRWRKGFGFDQLKGIIQELTDNPTSRRAVLQIWDARLDLGTKSVDIPCNDMVQFEIDKGVLNMSVFNRSNDMIWGAYGANAVQFSILQEYIAGMLGVPVGKYWQISCNFHAYTETFTPFKSMEGITEADEYLLHNIKPYNLVTDPDMFDFELYQFMENPQIYEGLAKNTFFPHVAYPIYKAWEARKSGDSESCMLYLKQCEAEDWKLACQQWIERREQKANANSK